MKCARTPWKKTLAKHSKARVSDATLAYPNQNKHITPAEVEVLYRTIGATVPKGLIKFYLTERRHHRKVVGRRRKYQNSPA